MENHDCKTFKEVHDNELNGPIDERRTFWRNRAKELDPKLAYPLSDGSDLVGIALSGGGIRSAMYNLGLLQSFQKAGLMKHADYLSSVSGGAYTNGYYSTLKHFATSEQDKAPIKADNIENPHSKPECLSGLSARDAQFLLDGQYLNRPIEFVTSYLVKTSMVLGTFIACLMGLACLIAMFFRYFDDPSVRCWLELLDLSSDLRVGLFGCVILAGIVLSVQGIVRFIKKTLRIPVSPLNGQWIVVIGCAFLLGIAIMIGNGDFYISDGTGFLPQKLDLQAYQIPIAAVVVLMFLPMVRFSSLLNSERVNATATQKIVLSIVLFGTTWGAMFAVVGLIGKENVSGFIDNRSPKFVRYDILNPVELARLLKAGDSDNAKNIDAEESIPQLQQMVRNRLKDDQEKLDELSKQVEETLALDRQRVNAQAILRPERKQWGSWSTFWSSTLFRWAQTVGHMVPIPPLDRSVVQKFFENDRKIFEVQQEKLSGYIEEMINPTIETQVDQVNLLDDKLRKRDVLTKELLTLTAERIRAAASATTASSNNPSAATKDNNDLSKDLVTHSAENTSEKMSIQDSTSRKIDLGEAKNKKRLQNNLKTVADWIESGGKLARTEDKAYLDLAEFQKLFLRCWRTSDDWDIRSLSDLDEWRINRMLLEIAYPQVFKERAMISTSIVVGEDQSFRLMILGCSTLLALLGIATLDLNWASALFHFYRKRIGLTFLEKANSKGIMPLSDLDPSKNGYPYPLFVAGMILPQAPAYGSPGSTKSEQSNPSKLDESFASNWYSFLLSPRFCGWLPTGISPKNATLKTYRDTKEYAGGKLKVDDAIVLSGAAVTPYMAGNPSLQLLMHIFNFRLEQWLPNPRSSKQPTNRKFSLLDAAREWFRRGSWNQDAWSYGVIADGGFREFLGVEELVARRCKIIVASDAGCNNGLYEFGVLADLIRKLRLDHSIEILDLDHDRPLDTRRLRRSANLDGRSAQHFVMGRIRYPEKVHRKETESSTSDDPPNKEGLLVYLQMSLTGDEDIDIEQFRRTNPNFPDEPISNQFYSRDQVESFRQLGEHIGQLLCRDIDLFDCPTQPIAEVSGKGSNDPETKLREWRIRKLEDAFHSGYRNECRQESIVANDDARIGWILNLDHVEYETLCRVHRYEYSTEHQLLIRDFVWHVLDDLTSEREAEFERILPADIFGIAIECNRRHAGFRPEWPTAFFQVAGRDLLIKASQIAHTVMSADKPKTNELDEFEAWIAGHTSQANIPKLIRSLSRLAVMLPRGVFRLRGSRSTADLLACLMNYVFRQRLGRTSDSLAWIRCERSQKILRNAIRTGQALEVESALIRLFKKQFDEASGIEHEELIPVRTGKI